MTARRQRLDSARLYLVCNAPSNGFLRSCLRGGVDMVQLRMKDADDQTIIRTAERVAEICREYGALFILNDRPDLVEAAGADGVHVGQGDAPVAVARELVGAGRLVGLSTHTSAQIEAAQGVDYIGVGPVYETPTKPGRPPVGLELVRRAADRASVPFFAIGGISAENVGAARAAGAGRVAVVRALTEADDPFQTARRIKQGLMAAEPVEAGVGAA